MSAPMHASLDTRGSTHGLRLGGELTIYAAAPLKDALQAALAAATELEIDLAEVSEIDSCGMQLLAAAKRAATEAGKTLRLMNHSATVIDLMELYDLAGWFGDPLVLQAPASTGDTAWH
jgi:anti-sigma B factor antagonist